MQRWGRSVSALCLAIWLSGCETMLVETRTVVPKPPRAWLDPTPIPDPGVLSDALELFAYAELLQLTIEQCNADKRSTLAVWEDMAQIYAAEKSE